MPVDYTEKDTGKYKQSVEAQVGVSEDGVGVDGFRGRRFWVGGCLFPMGCMVGARVLREKEGSGLSDVEKVSPRQVSFPFLVL